MPPSICRRNRIRDNRQWVVNPPLDGLDEVHDRHHVIEDQQGLIRVEHLVRMRKALAIPHVVEGVHLSEGVLQDLVAHLGTEMALALDQLQVLPEEAVGRLFTGGLDTALLARLPEERHEIRVQAIKPRLGLVRFDGAPHLPRQHRECRFARTRRDAAKHRCALHPGRPPRTSRMFAGIPAAAPARTNRG